MNNKGIVEAGLAIITGIIVTVVAVSGALFTSGSPIGASLLLTSAAATVYTNTPHVKRKFRERKAIEQCEAAEGAQCTQMVKEWSDEDLLDYIRDDEPGELNRVMYMEANPNWRLGG